MLSGDMRVPRPDLVRPQPASAVSPPPPEVQSEPIQESPPVGQPDAETADLAPDANRVTLRSEFSAFDPVSRDGVFNLNLRPRSVPLTPDLLYDDSEIRLSPRFSPDLLGRSAFGSSNGFGLNLNAFDFSPTALRFSAPAEPAAEIPQAPAPDSDSVTAAVPEPLASLPEAEGLSSSRAVLRGEQLEARIAEIQGQITSGLERLGQLPEGEARNAAQERLTELQTLINENAASPELVAQLQQHLLSQDTASESDASFHERLTAPHTDNGEPLADPVDNLYGSRTDAALRDYVERLANVSPEASSVPVAPEPQPEAVVENPPVEVSEEPIAEMPVAAEPVEEAPASEPEPETEVGEPAEDLAEADPGSGSPLASLTVQEAGDAQDIPARLEAIDQEIENLGGRPLLRKFAANEDLIMAASRVRSGLTQAENEPLLQQSDAASDFQEWIHFNEGFFEQNPEQREALQGLMTERIQLMLSQQREQMSSEDGASLAQISFEPFSYQAFLQPATYIEWGPVDLFNADATRMA